MTHYLSILHKIGTVTHRASTGERNCRVSREMAAWSIEERELTAW